MLQTLLQANVRGPLATLEPLQRSADGRCSDHRGRVQREPELCGTIEKYTIFYNRVYMLFNQYCYIQLEVRYEYIFYGA